MAKISTRVWERSRHSDTDTRCQVSCNYGLDLTNIIQFSMTTKVAAIRCACKLKGNPAPARHELLAAAAAVGTRLQKPLVMISRNMELAFAFKHHLDTMDCCISQCHCHPVTIELS